MKQIPAVGLVVLASALCAPAAAVAGSGLTLTGSSATAKVGTRFTYAVTLRNEGTAALKGVTISFGMSREPAAPSGGPAGPQFVTATTNRGSCERLNPSSAGYYCTIGSIAARSVIRLSFVIVPLEQATKDQFAARAYAAAAGSSESATVTLPTTVTR